MLKPLGDRVVLKVEEKNRKLVALSLLVQGRTQQKKRQSSQSVKGSVRSMENWSHQVSSQVIRF